MSILFLFSNPNRLPTRLLPVMDSAAYSQLKQLWLHTHQRPESLHLVTRSHQSTTQHYTPTNPVPALICIEHHSEQSLHCVPITHGGVVSPIWFLLQVWDNAVSTVPTAGLPLNLDNGNGRTFPYHGQSNYR